MIPIGAVHMEVMRFLLFSSLEWLALFILTFAMFKFPYRGFWGQLILCSFLLSLLSYVLFDVLNMRPIAPAFQLPLVILCTWQIFRVHLFYAAIVTTYGYVAYSFLQSLYILVWKISGFTFEETLALPNGYYLQYLTILSALIIGWVIYKRRLGFTFVPDFEHVRVEFRGINLWLLVLVILGNLQVASYSLIAQRSVETVFLSGVVLLVLLYFARKKEYSHD